MNSEQDSSRSEIVLPLIRNGTVLGVLDIDSPLPARFDDDDQILLLEITGIFMKSIE